MDSPGRCFVQTTVTLCVHVHSTRSHTFRELPALPDASKRSCHLSTKRPSCWIVFATLPRGNCQDSGFVPHGFAMECAALSMTGRCYGFARNMAVIHVTTGASQGHSVFVVGHPRPSLENGETTTSRAPGNPQCVIGVPRFWKGARLCLSAVICFWWHHLGRRLTCKSR